MRWTFVLVIFAIGGQISVINSNTVSLAFNGNYTGLNNVAKNLDILSELSSKLREAAESLQSPKQNISRTISNITDTIEFAESRPDGIVDILKSLNLPADFAGRSDERPAFLFTEATSLRPPPTMGPSSTVTQAAAAALPILTRLARQDPPMATTENPSADLKFMTGNAMLDKIMSCPCAKDKLRAVGVKGVAYSNQPNPAIYADPPYGPDMLGPGDLIATNLKSVGGSTGNVFGQIIRLILSVPTLAVALLKPLIVGLADTLSQTTEAAAGVTDVAAKTIPVTLRSSAVVIKRLIETAGDVTGSILHVAANLVAALGAAKTSVAGTLPFAFDAIGDVTKQVSGTVGTAVDFVAGTTEVLSAGVVNAAKTGGNLFSGFVEGAKGFQSGLLEGIKYGVNDEEPPADPNAQAWRR